MQRARLDEPFFVAVPIIPEFLYDIRHQQDQNNVTTTPLDVTTPDPGLSSLSEVEYDTALEDAMLDESDLNETMKSIRELKIEESKKRRRHRELVSENVEVGIMFASKAVVQLIANPFVGPLTNK